MIGEYTTVDWTHLIGTDVSKRFVEAFTKKHGRMPWGFEVKTHSGAIVALEALKATGGDTIPEKLRQAIMAVDFEAPEGRIRLDPETRFAIADVFICKIDKVGEDYVMVPAYILEDVPPRGY